MRPTRRLVRERYEDVVLRTRPVFYVPMQGNTSRELVSQSVILTQTATLQISGPAQGMTARRFTASSADDDKLVYTSQASYHPGNTFSIGGWFNRLGAGDAANAPTIFHNGTGDLTVYFPLSGQTNKLTLRRAGTGEIFATDRVFATPYADGWVHCLFTKDAGTATVCYLNGVSVSGTYTNQTVVASSSNPTFGTASGANTNDFDGALAHWAMWNRVLTAGEAAELYRASFR
jgi:hypothetical protein